MDAKNQQNRTGSALLSLLFFLVMIGVNALANILPINGLNTGEVSDMYPDLFAPTALTFSIWGLIYLLLALSILYRLGLFGGKESTDIFEEIDTWFIVSSVANAAWIFAWHYLMIEVTVALMLLIFISLAMINVRLHQVNLNAKEKFFIRLPFSIYFGWITVATIANITALLVDLGWNVWNIAPQIWTAIIIIVGMLIGSITILKHKDTAYGLVIIWAYVGIIIKHLSPDAFAKMYPNVITTTGVCIGILAIACIFAFLKRKK